MNAAKKEKTSRTVGRLKRALLFFFGGVAALVILFGGTLWVFSVCSWGIFKPKNPFAAETPAAGSFFYKDGERYEYNSDVYSVLLLGTDAGNGDENNLLAGQADVILLASFNAKTKKLHLLQIPRDTFVGVRQYNSVNEYGEVIDAPVCIAWAYGDGGVSSGNMMQLAVSELLQDIPINRFAAVDIEFISWIADWLGGVSVYDYMDFEESWNEDWWLLSEPTGPLVVYGEFAELYVRARSWPGMDGSDQRRSDRVMDFFFSVFSIIKERGAKNPLFLYRLYRDMNREIGYSTDLSFREIVFFGRGVMRAEIAAQRIPGMSVLGNEMFDVEFVPDEDALRAYIEEVYYIPVS